MRVGINRRQDAFKLPLLVLVFSELVGTIDCQASTQNAKESTWRLHMNKKISKLIASLVKHFRVILFLDFYGKEKAQWVKHTLINDQ